jgi:hypothetical protein
MTVYFLIRLELWSLDWSSIRVPLGKYWISKKVAETKSLYLSVIKRVKKYWQKVSVFSARHLLSLEHTSGSK